MRIGRAESVGQTIQFAPQPGGRWSPILQGMESVVKLVSADCELTFNEIYRLMSSLSTGTVLRPA
jgi:hypothetical protein